MRKTIVFGLSAAALFAAAAFAQDEDRAHEWPRPIRLAAAFTKLDADAGRTRVGHRGRE